MPSTAATLGLVDGYSRWELLAHLLKEVVARHEPDAARVLNGETLERQPAPATLCRILQAQSIMFQLLTIAEQNRDMRNRRELERQQGRAAVKGTFAAALDAVKRAGVSGEQVLELLAIDPDPSRDDRTSDRGEAGHRAGVPPPDLS